MSWSVFWVEAVLGIVWMVITPNVHHDIDGQLDDYLLEEWVTTKMTGGFTI